MTNQYLRFPFVHQATGLSRSTIFRLERIGDFPKRRQISPGAVAWLKEEVEQWMHSRAMTKGAQHG